MGETSGIDLWTMGDLRTPWCIYVAVTLHIAELIANGKSKIGELAAAAGCDRSALHAVLGHLVSKGVFKEQMPGKFELNDISRQLLEPIAQISFNLNGIGGRFAYAWGTLLEYTQTGKPAYDKVFGMPFWDDLQTHPDLAASFDTIIGPAGHSTPNPEFQISGGWESIQTVVDVGGGTGAMLAEILRKWQHLRGILVDLPRTITKADEMFKAAGVHKRVTTIGQSFFDPLPIGGDIYLLRGILNDWPDSECVAILKRCAEAALANRNGRQTSRVVVLKSVRPDDAPKDLVIEMVLLGGRQRTITEFRELARASGLDVVAARQHESGYYVVECIPNLHKTNGT